MVTGVAARWANCPLTGDTFFLFKLLFPKLNVKNKQTKKTPQTFAFIRYPSITFKCKLTLKDHTTYQKLKVMTLKIYNK